MHIETTYVDGKLHGCYKEYEDRQLKIETTYVNGNKPLENKLRCPICRQCENCENLQLNNKKEECAVCKEVVYLSTLKCHDTHRLCLDCINVLKY